MLAGLAVGWAFGQSAAALRLSLPAGSDLTASDELPAGVQIPIGAAREGLVPRADFTGVVRRNAYFIPGAEGTLALTAPLRDQLEQAGWTLLVDCAEAACGGFDFRFALSVLPEPAMHVDLGDFRYLAARKDDELVAILASKRGGAGYLQITHASQPLGPTDGGNADGSADDGSASPGSGAGSGLDGAQGGPAKPITGAELDGPSAGSSGGEAPVVITPGAAPEPIPAASGFMAGQIGATLETLGHVVLTDLDFATGSTNLGSGPFASLAELASYLAEHPTRKVALVGHTDATGGLEVNISVSRRRAQSVLEHLVSQHKVPKAQLVAEGVGYLAPLQSNLADAGRSANRRVEVVLISVE